MNVHPQTPRIFQAYLHTCGLGKVVWNDLRLWESSPHPVGMFPCKRKQEGWERQATRVVAFPHPHASS